MPFFHYYYYYYYYYYLNVKLTTKLKQIKRKYGLNIELSGRLIKKEEEMTAVLLNKVQHYVAICISSVFLQMLDKRKSVDL